MISHLLGIWILLLYPGVFLESIFQVKLLNLAVLLFKRSSYEEKIYTIFVKQYFKPVSHILQHNTLILKEDVNGPVRPIILQPLFLVTLSPFPSETSINGFCR